jgi:uncharacterized protein (DUF983 family)
MSISPDTKPPAQRPRRSWFVAVLKQRCPRCREGRIFKGMAAMNDPCLVCGLVFEREPGYFYGAMYFSYGLSVLILVPLYFLAAWLFPDVDYLLVPLIAFIPYFPLIPMIFRYSRVLWIYFDRGLAPSEISTHEGWMRWREQQDRDKKKD